MTRAVSVRVGVAAVLIMSLLAAAGPPASAADAAMQSDGLVVGSQHTDFGTGDEPAPQTLTNLTAGGSGDTATVSLESTSGLQLRDGFEDGDISEYSGDTSAFSISTDAYEGSNALTASQSTNVQAISRTDLAVAQGDTIQWQQNISGSNIDAGIVFGVQSATGGGSLSAYYASIQEDRLRLFRIDSGSSTEIAASSTTTVPTGEYLNATIDWGTDDSITFRVEDSNGNLVREIQATDSTYQSGGFGFRIFDGTATWDAFKSSGPASPDSATYVSAVHDIDDGEEAAINVTQHSNVSVEATVRTDGGTVLNQSTLSGTGNHTLQLSSTSSSQLETALDVDVTGDNPTFELADESILFTNHSPQASNASPDGTATNNENAELSVDINDTEFGTAQGEEVDVEWFVDGSSVATETITSNRTVTHTASGLSDGSHSWHVELTDSYGATTTSTTWTFDVNHYAPTASNLQPADGTQLQSREQDFSVDVNDTDFAEPSGDEVTAELFIDGSSVGTQTITSNQTVTISHTLSMGGEHTYYWELTDEYGLNTTTATRSVFSPSDLYIRSETNPSQFVDDAQVNITYYYGDELLRANTTDGTVNLTGLPVDEPIIALAEADGYHTRTAVIRSIYEQNSLYMLNSSLDSYQLIFDITDPSGSYPRSNTILEVQRDIKLNGTTEWRTVTGDVFGAQGVTTDLEAGERYRLIVRNLETGERATLGSFTPVASQEITLEPESATVSVGLEDNTSIGYSASRSSSGDAIIVEYADPTESTTQLTFMIHERFNESNVLLQNQSFTDLGNLTYSEPLNASAQNQSWVVEFYWERSNGVSSEAQVVVGQGPRDGLIPNNLDTVYRVSIGVAVLLITALLFSQLNVGVGAVTTSLVGGLLWYLGFLSTVTTGPAVVLAIGTSGLLYYNSGGGVT